MLELLLTIHILAAIVWIGGGIALNVLISRAPATDRGVIVPNAAWFGKYVLTGSSIVLLLAGFGLVAELDLSLGEPFILIGLAIWLISGILGGAVIGKAADQLAEVVSGEGPPDPALVERLFQRIMLFSRLDILLTVGAVVDMVYKPGL